LAKWIANSAGSNGIADYAIIKQMRPSTDMIEGPEAWTRFREAAKKMLSVPKGAVPNPFGKRKKKNAKNPTTNRQLH
jgi:hypothetical protein